MRHRKKDLIGKRHRYVRLHRKKGFRPIRDRWQIGIAVKLLFIFVSGALVHLMDVFPTVLELAGGSIDTLWSESGEPVHLDAVSLWPALEAPETASIRPWVVVEHNGPVGPPPYVFDRVAVRDARYKLVDIRVAGETTQLRLHDLTDRWDDGPNLLDGPLTSEAEAALLRLTDWAEAHRAIPYEGP